MAAGWRRSTTTRAPPRPLRTCPAPRRATYLPRSRCGQARDRGLPDVAVSVHAAWPAGAAGPRQASRSFTPEARPQAKSDLLSNELVQYRTCRLDQVVKQAAAPRQPAPAAARSASQQGQESRAAAAAALQRRRRRTTTSRTLMSWSWRMLRKTRRAAFRALLCIDGSSVVQHTRVTTAVTRTQFEQGVIELAGMRKLVRCVLDAIVFW